MQNAADNGQTGTSDGSGIDSSEVGEISQEPGAREGAEVGQPKAETQVAAVEGALLQGVLTPPGMPRAPMEIRYYAPDAIKAECDALEVGLPYSEMISPPESSLNGTTGPMLSLPEHSELVWFTDFGTDPAGNAYIGLGYLQGSAEVSERLFPPAGHPIAELILRYARESEA